MKNTAEPEEQVATARHAAGAVLLARFGWLVLAGMMLASRVAFQLAGPVRMRAFLDTWRVSATKRVWGTVALAFGAAVTVAAARARWALRPAETLLFLLLVLVLTVDGLLNVLPGGFSRFKEELQRQWVRRQRDPAAQGDRALFGTVNLLLGVAATATGAAVAGYAPLPRGTLVGAAGTALALTGALVAGAVLEGRARRPRRPPGARPGP